MTEQTYKSGGGESRLIEVPGAGLLRIEAQRESFALMWPSQLTAAAFFDAARSVWWSKYGNVSLMSFEKSEVAELPVADLSVWLKKEEAILFARIDFQDRALTWAAQYKDPERSGLKVNPEVQQAREVSLSGLKFDPDHASRLLVATALKPMAELVDELMASATETLSAYA